MNVDVIAGRGALDLGGISAIGYVGDFLQR